MSFKKSKSIKSSNFGLRGVGPQIAKHLARLDIYSASDLLFHLPARYQDRTQIQPIRLLSPDKEAVVEGIIKDVSSPSKGKTKLLCEIQDETGRLFLRFFHVFPQQLEIFRIGTRLRCYSDVRLGPKGFEMTHPEVQIIKENIEIPIEQHFTPIYPATEGLSQYMLRKLTQNALLWMEKQNTFNELFPEELLNEFNFPTLKDALKFVHKPPREISIPHLMENKTQPQKRLVFEELLAHRVSLLQVKKHFQNQKAHALASSTKLVKTFLCGLSFKLTNAQERVYHEIQQDLTQAYPMLRLVQGDVGSGKTVVAALAMLQAVENGYQAALMAPTELLAEQHYRVFKRWFEPLGVNLVFLSGNVKGQARKNTLKLIETNSAPIILGTHALFQEGVKFSKLALVVVDEQHRFGVHQRALFREKGLTENGYPHQLVMTATPIPRTLAMSLYADLDVSIIDELPPGRTPIMTTVMAASRRDEVITRVKEACKQGKQIYWVCPLIEESETIACQAATLTAQDLQKILPDIKVGLVHGRMSADDKESTMQMFQSGETQLLVATTVIEVGVDVPNASVMVIENAERMGLSQLHQLRGRVGRGSVASHCVLLYQHPLSDLAKQRLSVMRETTDGFKIAQRDLELRGPGEVLGTRQTGELSFKIADLIRDSEILPMVHLAAEKLLHHHPEKIAALIQRWIGENQAYAKI